jgi:SAM-dependent methyltransferase
MSETASPAHGLEPPSAWVQRWTHLVKPRATVLDLACGHGRHMKWFAGQGHAVTGVDRSPEAIAAVAPWGEAIVADIENGLWPLTQAGKLRQFDAVVVTNYLWRALFPVIQDSLAPGGVLIYETFAVGNETVGKPSRPDFLLQPGELLPAFAGLKVIAFEDGFIAQPERFVQRIAAVRDGAPVSTDQRPPRYFL